jgi:hypothetical protein
LVAPQSRLRALHGDSRAVASMNGTLSVHMAICHRES